MRLDKECEETGQATELYPVGQVGRNLNFKNLGHHMFIQILKHTGEKSLAEFCTRGRKGNTDI